MSHFVSIRAMRADDIQYMFDLAAALRATDPRERAEILRHRVVASAFYQPSTRTRTAFEAGALRLGAGCTGFADARTTRAGDYYRESLEDVVSNLGWIADAIVLRHFEAGAAARAAAVSPVPVLNAGDGYNEHPSQALGDAWTMHQCLGGLAGARIGMLGNPHVRSLHSLSLVLAQLDVAEVVYLLAPGTDVPEDVRAVFATEGVRWSTVEHVQDLVKECDLVETIGTRHPDHRLAHQEPGEDERTPERYRIDADLLARVGGDVPVLHPGPRTDEIAVDVDPLPCARYLPQVEHGMWMKAAMLAVSLVERAALPVAAP